MSRFCVSAVLTVALLGLSVCGAAYAEKEQEIVYKPDNYRFERLGDLYRRYQEQGVVYKKSGYRGKSDDKPWENTVFAGDKAKWESNIRSRGRNQNESAHR